MPSRQSGADGLLRMEKELGSGGARRRGLEKRDCGVRDSARLLIIQ